MRAQRSVTLGSSMRTSSKNPRSGQPGSRSAVAAPSVLPLSPAVATFPVGLGSFSLISGMRISSVDLKKSLAQPGI